MRGGGGGGWNWAYDPDLKVGGEASKDGSLSRRGVLLGLGRHRRRSAAMRPEGWLGFFVGSGGSALAVADRVGEMTRIRGGWAGLGCEMGDRMKCCGEIFFLFLFLH